MTTITTKNAVIGTSEGKKAETYANKLAAVANDTAKKAADLTKIAKDATVKASSYTIMADGERAALQALTDGWRSGDETGTAAELAEHRAEADRYDILAAGATARANAATKSKPNDDYSGAKVVADAIDKATGGFWWTFPIAAPYGAALPVPTPEDLTAPVVIVGQPTPSERALDGSFTTTCHVTLHRRAHIHGGLPFDRIEDAAEAAGQYIEFGDDRYGLQPEPDKHGIVAESYRVSVRRGAAELPSIIEPLQDHQVDELHRAVEPLLFKLNEGNSDQISCVDVVVGKSTKRPKNVTDQALLVSFKMAVHQAPKFANPSAKLRERLEDEHEENDYALMAMESRGFKPRTGPNYRTGVTDEARESFNLAVSELDSMFVAGVGRIVGVSSSIVADESGDRYIVNLTCRHRVDYAFEDDYEVTK